MPGHTAAKKKLNKIRILRMEQIYPFPRNSISKHLSKVKEARIIWCQEEPENMGAWSFVDRRLESAMIEANCKQKRPI